MIRVLGIGDNTVDIYVDHGLQFPGGNAVNVAVLTRRLGASSSYLGCIGADALGLLVRRALESEGVETSRIRTMDRPNSWSRVRHKGTDRYFDGNNSNLEGCYDLKDDDFHFISDHDVVHSSIYSRLEDDIARIGAAAPIFSFDYSTEYDDNYIAKTAPHVDIAFLSDADGDDEDCRALCRRVVSHGPSTVVVTRGLKGAIAFNSGEFFTQSVFAVESVDTLGAGDGFIAAFLMACQQLIGVAGALAMAARYAAEVCSYLGAFGHQTAVKRGQPGLLFHGD
jgi:fructoselysine 6-kinase